MGRTCIYFGCPSPEGGEVNKNITFFRFPKDESRRLTWAKYCGNEEEATIDRDVYLCERHFDNRYIAVNQRRKSLLHHAVPIHFKSDESMVLTDCIEDDSVHPNGQADEEPTTKRIRLDEVDGFAEAYLYENSDNEEDIEEVETEIELLESPTPKVDDICEKEEKQNGKDENVTTFIFKGEEYIQMPKETYLREKNKDTTEIRRLRNILDKIKANINDF